MRPEHQSLRLLGITRSKAKMYEYGVPIRDHIRIPRGAEPENLFSLAVGILGDYASASIEDEDQLPESGGKGDAALQFVTRFFDAYLEAKLNSTLDPYLLLVGASAYYLHDRPGSSQVLAKRLPSVDLELNARNLEILLAWLLREDRRSPMNGVNGRYGELISRVSGLLAQFTREGVRGDDVPKVTAQLRDLAYRYGSPRELLFADIIAAVTKRRIANSSWSCLPKYSGVSVDLWRPVLERVRFAGELWPAQRLLGDHGVLSGKSAVIQLPTSAGKTHALEMILRGAFLADRATVAVVVAPFRALCHEIGGRLTEAFREDGVEVNEVSDVLQMDAMLDIAKLLEMALVQSKAILVLTPEKLLYLLRHSPEIGKHIGLVVLDEGHQFDSGARGVTYELLVTVLKQLLPSTAQKILISAVIPNAEGISKWLLGDNGVTVIGNDLLPTERSIAFASWRTVKGQLEFVNPSNTSEQEFFVPRVLEQIKLEKRKGEKEYVFPNREKGQSIALFLALRLAGQGGVAIFCGRKDSAASLSELLVEIESRGLEMPLPSLYSDEAEVRRLQFLHEQHFGPTSTLAVCAGWGVYLHHGNTPQGLRLAIEHAMKLGYIKLVICTSTLAQGVNLPIRYLIVTTIYQAGDRIKVRDFHNLIGRTGRSGLHTEGSILFSDPAIFDKRTAGWENWRWQLVDQILQPGNVEPCSSSLLSILDPLGSEDKKNYLDLTPLRLVELYVEDKDGLYEQVAQFGEENKDAGFSREGLTRQLEAKLRLLMAVESYLMANRDPDSTHSFDEESRRLAQQTLAYYLATPDQQGNLVDIFRKLAMHVESKIPDQVKQKAYGKTLYGVHDSLAIEKWARENLEAICKCESDEQLLNVLWPLVQINVSHNLFKKCDLPSSLKVLASSWIAGKSFGELFAEFTASGAKRRWGKTKRAYKTDDVVDLCEDALGYEATLVVGGVVDLLGDASLGEKAVPSELFQSLQKRLRYGVPDRVATIVHECGFADRAVAKSLRDIIGSTASSRREVLEAFRTNEKRVSEELDMYPSYFQQIHRALSA